MKYDNENLQNLKKIGEKISEMINGELTDFVNRTINIKSELSLADEVLLTPERTDKDIARRAGLIKEYGETFVKQRETILQIRQLVNQLTAYMQIDYVDTAQVIQAKQITIEQE